MSTFTFAIIVKFGNKEVTQWQKRYCQIISVNFTNKKPLGLNYLAYTPPCLF